MKKISVVLPCRNEEKTIGICIKKIKAAMEKLREKDYEIIVSDSSEDHSPEIAKGLGAIVVEHNKAGYGNACLEGFRCAKGSLIILGDADNTYDFFEIPALLKYIDECDLVLGERKFIQKGAMSTLHRYVGNPFLSFVLRILFRAKIMDTHTGFRAIKKEKLRELDLRTTGMEFASEMIIKAIKNRLKIKEVPVHYYKREGSSKLRSFSDGWRHLRFMLIYSPDYLFMLPGFLLFLMGIVIMALLLAGPIELFGIAFYTHPMIVGSFLAILGYQIINLGLCSKTYAIKTGFEKEDRLVDKLAQLVTFESGIALGLAILLISFIIGFVILFNWVEKGFPALAETNIMLVVLTLAILGIQTIFSALFLSIMLVEKK